MNSPTPPSTSSPQSQAGIVHRVRVRLFGERDVVAAQLRDIARQGASMARLAHACAFLLIVLFSAGSLVALGGDALIAILAGWQQGRVDMPATISVAVSTLLVLCMDTAMLYAASMLRLLATRRAEAHERRIHQLVMGTVAVLEAATYAYMGARYEHPAGAVVWALIAARAAAAPLLSVYLSMARPLPITARDILYQAELAAGQGVIRDVVSVARDASAPLADKMALYGAAATMIASDRQRLDDMIAVVAQRQTPTARVLADGITPAVDPLRAPQEARELPDRDGVGIEPSTTREAPPRPPTGPGSPAAAPVRTRRRETASAASVLRLEAPKEWRQNAGRGRANGRGVRTPARTATVEARVRAVWQPGMSVTQLERTAGISRNAAGKWRKVLLAEATLGDTLLAR